MRKRVCSKLPDFHLHQHKPFQSASSIERHKTSTSHNQLDSRVCDCLSDHLPQYSANKRINEIDTPDLPKRTAPPSTAVLHLFRAAFLDLTRRCTHIDASYDIFLRVIARLCEQHQIFGILQIFTPHRPPTTYENPLRFSQKREPYYNGRRTGTRNGSCQSKVSGSELPMILPRDGADPRVVIMLHQTTGRLISRFQPRTPDIKPR
jgi:hypothetical protein